MTFDSKTFRAAMGRFATGVTVVTARRADGAPVGVTVNAFCSVSLDPPLVLVCLGERTADLDAFAGGAGFVVNVLGDDQRAVSDRFATRRDDKFEETSWRAGEGGLPMLDGCLAQFECALHAVHDGGDHRIVIGRVERLHLADDGAPLLFFRGGYGALAV